MHPTHFLPLAIRRAGSMSHLSRFFLLNSRSVSTTPTPEPHGTPPDPLQVKTKKLKPYSRIGKSFVDVARCGIRGGVGGDGCASFVRDNRVAAGPPDGGNGGVGGDVYVEADDNLTSLQHIGNTTSGGRGGHGRGQLQHGRKGRDVILKVPTGTTVQEVQLEKFELGKVRESYRVSYKLYPGWEDLGDKFSPPRHSKALQSEKAEARSNLLLGLRGDEEWMQAQRDKGVEQPMLYFDMLQHGERYLLAKGGSGGSGNRRFASTENPHPKFATKGVTGQIRRFQFELKTIADAGLVGLPNAGKSTFLTAVSNAHPKIAPYPFTTLNPFIGTVDYADLVQIKIADIPGLVADAHLNVGLGHSFLRHVERSKILVYVIDLSGPAPWADLATLRNELEQYMPGLSRKPSIIVANKADQVRTAQPNLEKWKRRCPEDAENLIPVSAKHKKNILKVTDLVRKLVEEWNQLEREKADEEECAFSERRRILAERERVVVVADEPKEPSSSSPWEIVDTTRSPASRTLPRHNNKDATSKEE